MQPANGIACPNCGAKAICKETYKRNESIVRRRICAECQMRVMTREVVIYVEKIRSRATKPISEQCHSTEYRELSDGTI